MHLQCLSLLILIRKEQNEQTKSGFFHSSLDNWFEFPTATRLIGQYSDRLEDISELTSLMYSSTVLIVFLFNAAIFAVMALANRLHRLALACGKLSTTKRKSSSLACGAESFVPRELLAFDTSSWISTESRDKRPIISSTAPKNLADSDL